MNLTTYIINVQKHFCEHFNLNIYSPSKGEIPSTNSQKTVTEIYNLIKDIKPEILASEIFKNRQRTSTTNGILKTDAVLRFLKILKDFHAETYSDISNLTNNETFEECIKRIPGQNSGISLKYFFMLTGSRDQIKPDRMILGFIKDATNRTVSPNEALDLIRSTVNELIKMGYKHLSPRHLDNLIWNFQRG